MGGTVRPGAKDVAVTMASTAGASAPNAHHGRVPSLGLQTTSSGIRSEAKAMGASTANPVAAKPTACVTADGGEASAVVSNALRSPS